MSKGNKTVEQGEHSTLGFGQGLQGNANSLYSTLAPQLVTQSMHPAGYAPTDLASMNTAAQQSAGGSAAAAKGEGALLASRTGNVGMPAAAVAKSVRSAGENLGDKAVGIQNENALMKEKQREGAQEGLSRLYSTSVSGANQSMGELSGLANADAEAKKSGFFNQFGNSFFSSLGKGVGSGMTGGAGR